MSRITRRLLSRLIDTSRNPSLTRRDIEKFLHDYLGVRSVLWLKEGIVNDLDTDGHVDNLVAFVRPGEVSAEGSGLLRC